MTAAILENQAAQSLPARPRVLMAATVGISVRGGLLPFARHFRRMGWEVDAMARGITEYEECREAFDNVWEASWARNPLDRHNMTTAVAEVRRVVEARRPDIVHVHTPVAALAVRYALRNQPAGGPRIVYTAHGFHFHPLRGALSNMFYRSIEKMAARWTDYIVVINRTDLQACADHSLAPRGGVRYMPGIGIDTKRLSSANVPQSEIDRVRHEMGLGPQTKLFLMVAEINKTKRQTDALRAFAQLKHPDAVLGIAGTGPMLATAKELAASLGISSRVRFLGFRRDIGALMRAAAALVLPSDREGLPLCLMEAMSLEVPVITTRVRGSEDLAGEGCGYLFSVGDLAALTAAMARVIEAPDEAAAQASKAHHRIRDFDLQRVIELHEELYTEALGERHVS